VLALFVLCWCKAGARSWGVIERSLPTLTTSKDRPVFRVEDYYISGSIPVKWELSYWRVALKKDYPERVMIFINGECTKQVEWACQHKNAYIIITHGYPVRLWKKHARVFWVDYNKKLQSLLGVKSLPAKVIIKGRVAYGEAGCSLLV